MDYLDKAAHLANVGNSIAYAYDDRKAIQEDDPVKRNLHASRVYCYDKLMYSQLKAAALAFILPFLLVIILVMTGTGSAGMYFVLGIWLLGGMGYLKLNQLWIIAQRFKISTANSIEQLQNYCTF